MISVFMGYVNNMTLDMVFNIIEVIFYAVVIIWLIKHWNS